MDTVACGTLFGLQGPLCTDGPFVASAYRHRPVALLTSMDASLFNSTAYRPLAYVVSVLGRA